MVERKNEEVMHICMHCKNWVWEVKGDSFIFHRQNLCSLKHKKVDYSDTCNHWRRGRSYRKKH